MATYSFGQFKRACATSVALFTLATFVGSGVLAETPDNPSDLNHADTVDPNEDEADDLDSLLDMADKDLSLLSRVNVAAPMLATEVTTVSRQKSTLGRTPAAVFVITNEMIRRSGARSVPEALRLAPGVQVARVSAGRWAISIRGFSGVFANKLLVQIDGRSVYTPLFAGVFWDAQDVLLEDVDRIEVIRGPGATVWGANAVNGVINILTKSASETQGLFAETGGGTFERGFASARYGGQLSENADYRVYGKWFDRTSATFSGTNQDDNLQMGQAGFRMDWTPTDSDLVTFQGDTYEGTNGGQANIAIPVFPFTEERVGDDVYRGRNSILRWTHTIDDDTDWSLQLYYDRTERRFVRLDLNEDRDTYDLDYQVRWRAQNHRLIAGFGYRLTEDNNENDPFRFPLTNPTRSDNLFSYFIQDEIELRQDELYATIGSKFQHNDYTGFEYQPTARLLWAPSPRRMAWLSVSRAVRTPSRLEEDYEFLLVPSFGVPVFPRFQGNPNLNAEQLIAYEAGVRSQPVDYFSWDFSVFYNDYDGLIDFAAGAPFAGPPPLVYVPVLFSNSTNSEAYGFELVANCDMTENWSLQSMYSFLRTGPQNLGSTSPRNQLNIWSSWDISRNWKADLIWRYVDRLPEEDIASYNATDVRLAWTPGGPWEFAVVGRHLFDTPRPEFGDGTFSDETQVQSEVYGIVTLRY
ncbi:MAG: TonB-dependent receptor [Planctomycetes bacterium]|nr:TonB-dependent receptor [Planctomycetota bacterium]